MKLSRLHIRLVAVIGLVALPFSTLAPVAVCNASAPVSERCCCGPGCCSAPEAGLKGDGCCCSVSEEPVQTPPIPVRATLTVKTADSDARPALSATPVADELTDSVDRSRERSGKPPGAPQIFLTVCSFLI
ncbi:MAG: hypothetical protein JSW50_14640 [Candidatus Latescibacterota bacterium]|nr:MAG: hypothetical protein JSW50_14640 [Candidatus Latescibacterota bacterium]